jgi:FAD-dependent oxidoreductase domain-containing protein 1
MGGVRQQFSLRENIELSLFGAHFLKHVDEYLGVEGQSPVDVQYRKRGYLFLTTTPQGAELLHENWSLQK